MNMGSLNMIINLNSIYSNFLIALNLKFSISYSEKMEILPKNNPKITIYLAFLNV